MDPLSDVLSLLKPRSYSSGGFDVGGELSIQFPRHEGIKCYAVLSGQCWLSVEDIADAVRLTAGDCFLLPSGRPFRLATNLTLTPIDALTIFATARKGSIYSFNGEPQPGGFLVAQQLAYLMLVQALRLHLAEGSSGGVGWLFALANKQMSAAITSMHDDPAHGWTVQELAERVGMSRSTFALKFKQTVGTSPMEYLTRWRMLLAGDKLSNSSDPISVIALSLGYESESAFSTTFKRFMGCSPRQYSRPTQRAKTALAGGPGRGRNPASPSHSEREAARTNRLEPVAG